ncbi:MAG: hypothetical protein QM754_05450 [Tepidisphaeraceae bacterium]
MLDYLLSLIGDRWMYERPSRIFAWVFGVLAFGSLIAGILNPARNWIGFVFCATFAALSYGCVAIGDRWEAGEYDRAVRRAKRKADQAKPAPRGFEVKRP